MILFMIKMVEVIPCDVSCILEGIPSFITIVHGRERAISTDYKVFFRVL